MKHRNYFEIVAKDHFQLGLKKGELFGENLRASISKAKSTGAWRHYAERSPGYLDITAKHFPDLIAEYQGYAKAAGVSFDEIWTLDLIDEITESNRCTTVVTNNGFLVAHNEDWTPSAANTVCLLRRTVGEQSAFEIFYLDTLGGNSISVNSHGITHAVNSLVHRDVRIGIPRNVIARAVSDLAAPAEMLESVAALPRASGYHHTLVDSLGSVWTMECSAKREVITDPDLPFAHTNHFVAPELQELEANSNVEGTYTRLQSAQDHTDVNMSRTTAQKLLGNTDQGRRRSIFNARTIARMVVDVDHMVADVWLARERKKGWIAYDVRF